jgi:RIO kinase 1
MRIPDSLATLFDYGILQELVRPLMSGKEAQVYLVVSGGKHCVAKVYKEAQNRTFKHRSEYTEGRKVRNSRDQRAIEKRSKHGRAQDETAWRSTEVDIIHRLHAAGVRVPTPQHFIDGVLIMELITGADGEPAPRLADLVFAPEGAWSMYERLIREVLRMLCAGVVHGDLSDFNVLVGAEGPVIIDFPQSVDTAQNTNARKLLLRDVENMYRFLRRFVPHARRLPYAEEMWELFQKNALTPETRLVGRYRPSERRANTDAVLELIEDAKYDEQKRRQSLGLRGGPSARHSKPLPPSSAHQGGQQRRPAPHPRDAQRGESAQGHAHSRRGPSPNGPSPSHPTHPEPARSGLSHTPPQARNGPQGQKPGSKGTPHGGPPHQNASGGAPPHRPAGQSSPSNATNRARDEGRRIEVIVARRPLIAGRTSQS